MTESVDWERAPEFFENIDTFRKDMCKAGFTADEYMAGIMIELVIGWKTNEKSWETVVEGLKFYWDSNEAGTRLTKENNDG